MRNLSGESKADIDRILEEFKKAKMVKIIKIIIFMTWHDHQKTPRRLKIKSLWSFLIVMISLINVLILIFIFIAMIITKIKIITIILILNQEIIELERKKLDLTQRERELAEQLEEDRSGIIISKFYL